MSEISNIQIEELNLGLKDTVAREQVGILEDETNRIKAELTEKAYNVKTHGAVGDGQSHKLSEYFTTLEQARLLYSSADSLDNEIFWAVTQSAIDDGHKNIYIPDGNYVTNKTILLDSGTNVNGDGIGNTVIDVRGNGEVVHFKTKEVVMTAFTQTTTLSEGENNIKLSSTLQKGDFIEITSNEPYEGLWESPLTREYYTIGELFKVEESTGTIVIFTEPSSFTLPFDKTRFTRGFTPIKNVYIGNMTLTRTFDTTSQSVNVYILNTESFVVENIRTENTNISGVQIERSMNGKIQYVEGKGGTDLLSQNYGVLISSGSKNVHANNIFGDSFRHVVAVGGSYSAPTDCSYTNVYAVNSQAGSIDAHGLSKNFLYENINVDNGISISGIGHTIRNVRSKGGAFNIQEGGKDLVFENINFLSCSRFYSNTRVINSSFKNVKLTLTGNISMLNGSSHDNTFENFHIVNSRSSGYATKVIADSDFATTWHRGFTIYDGDILNNFTIEGFPVACFITGKNITMNDIHIINCGWVSDVSSHDNVFLFSGVCDNVKISNVSIAFNLTGLDISTSTIFRLVTSDLTNPNITIRDVFYGKDHITNYGYVFIGGSKTNFFIQNVRTSSVSPSNLLGTGKFIYNTFIDDN